MKPVIVGLLGLGTVGTGVVRIIEGHREDLIVQVGSPIEVGRIAVRQLDKPRAVAVDPAKLTDDPWEIVRDPDIDVVVEVMGGVEQTKAYILEALRRGKHVVTANKDLMALHGSEILSTAREHGCDVMYEASVAGGIPIIRTLIEGFSSDRIDRIMGIVNGTTNYILTKMSQEGASYEEVLREAQQLGYAEADPTSDVEGLDAARKMTILATIGFRMNVELADVEVQGITKVTKEDIACAKKLGYELKLLGIADRQDDRISVSVQPTMVKREHPLASVNGVFNAVFVRGEAVGETMFYGAGAGELPTATSVVADIVAVAKNMKLGVNGRQSAAVFKAKNLKSDEEVAYKNFLLLNVVDRAGVLAKITQVFAEHDVSLESVLQQPTASDRTADLVIITHDASRAAMRRVLRAFESLDVIKRIKSVYRVEG
ncbi:MAG: homoserine dehydrogenase [Thermobacillus sp. ZCTH02-B1]|uniref:homoserine dehydrogenase n=1 Tax=Thermobacillus sp. ZCTH02-B1 TaxID=1858795 RepID=UPI000B56511B|nr:homoserine dehydrogenase [Thermobacillus sp. ZCTH02-B1]OUM96076.1 MAG: homoserine dehydrogenase [Thermobacillus sp. ZCTH02-B1]